MLQRRQALSSSCVALRRFDMVATSPTKVQFSKSAILARAAGRSSDLQAGSVAGRFYSSPLPNSNESVRFIETFVPVYRCGAVLELHQIPCFHAGISGIPTALVRVAHTTKR
jgi:hypothetical protein